MRARTTMRRSSRSCWIKMMRRRSKRLPRKEVRLRNKMRREKNRMKTMSMPRMMTTSTKKRCWT
jgi:hypothetical protein